MSLSLYIISYLFYLLSLFVSVNVSSVPLFRLAGFTKQSIKPLSQKNQNFPLRVETPLTTFYKRNHQTKISVITREILIVIMFIVMQVLLPHVLIIK